MSQTVKNTEHIKYVYFLQKGANLERQYEDRVQKMLSELREVSRLRLNYINCNAAFVCYFLTICMASLPEAAQSRCMKSR